MGFTPAPGVAQFNLKYTSFGDFQENVYHVHHKDASAWTNAQLVAMISVFGVWDNAHGAAMRTTFFSLFQLIGRDLSINGGAEASLAAAAPGTRAGDAFPENVTYAIEKSSGFSGRSNRGRVYHIGLVESDVANSRVLSATQAALLVSYNALLTAVNAVSNCELVILSKKDKSTGRVTPLAVPIVTFTVTDSFVDSQRRRLPAHNRHR